MVARTSLNVTFYLLCFSCFFPSRKVAWSAGRQGRTCSHQTRTTQIPCDESAPLQGELPEIFKDDSEIRRTEIPGPQQYRSIDKKNPPDTRYRPINAHLFPKKLHTSSVNTVLSWCRLKILLVSRYVCVI